VRLVSFYWVVNKPYASVVDSVDTVAASGALLNRGIIATRSHVVTPDQNQTNVNLFGDSYGLQSATISRFGAELSPTKTFNISAGAGTRTIAFNASETTNPDGSTTITSKIIWILLQQ